MNIHKAAGIIIRDRNLLVEKSKNKDFFISPGGSIEPGETAKQALARELMEEFQIIVEEGDMESFGTFSAAAAGNESKTVIMEVFMIKAFRGEPTPDSEVEKIAWINSVIPQEMKVGSIFEHQVIPLLKKRDLID
ncbi:MAG: NUDIX domain-containing protein [Candidatus Moraniibacteriota bacterium]|nr:MAG: NUDIX domain-containing protein [Candidatus Moranbacteria bacterium]